MSELLIEYSETFQGDIGMAHQSHRKRNPRCKISKSPHVLQTKARLLHLKPKLEVELKRLGLEGILHKVKFSDWATPVVPGCSQLPQCKIYGD